MIKLSSKTILLISIGAVLVIAAALLLTRWQARKRNPSLQSDSFESYYTDAIDSLHAHARAVQNKLRANLTGDLKLLPKELLRPLEPVEIENPGVPTRKSITLRGIYWSDTMPLAEINNRLCKPGDQIAGFTLKEIQPYQVILLDPEGGTNTISLVKDL